MNIVKDKQFISIMAEGGFHIKFYGFHYRVAQNSVKLRANLGATLWLKNYIFICRGVLFLFLIFIIEFYRYPDFFFRFWVIVFVFFAQNFKMWPVVQDISRIGQPASKDELENSGVIIIKNRI